MSADAVNPVVIVICDENEPKINNGDTTIFSKKNEISTPKKSTEKSLSSISHQDSFSKHLYGLALTETNSCPLEKFTGVTLLRVPGNLSSNTTTNGHDQPLSRNDSAFSIDSSPISCCDDLSADDSDFRVGHRFYLRPNSYRESFQSMGAELNMKCASAQNLPNAVSLTPKLCHLLGDSGHSNNHLQHRNLEKKKSESAGNNFLGHKSLTRTTSAPLKQSKDDSADSKSSKIGEERNSSNSSHAQYFNIFSPKVWKRSFLKMNDDKGGSRFSLRRTFSLRSSNSTNNGEGGHISFPSKSKKKRQKYKIVEAKTGQADGISFELVNKQGCFLRVKGTGLIPDRDNGSDSNFTKDVTFVPLPDMWFPSFFAFESVSKPSYFIRLLPEKELVLDKYDGTKDFKKDASFSLSRKPDATTLKKDVQAWVKSTTGEYYLGKILFVNDDIVKVEFSDGRQERCLRSEGFKLIPDIVPCPTNLRVGVRVISQFGHRHRFYPGVISSVRRNDSYDILFDDGDCGRGKSYQMRLMQNFPIHQNADLLTIDKENKPVHAPVKFVFSDPGGVEGNWCKFSRNASPRSSSTQLTGVTSLGEMSLNLDSSVLFHKDISNGTSAPNDNDTNNNVDNEDGAADSNQASLSTLHPLLELEALDKHRENTASKTINKNAGLSSNGYYIPRRKHGWVQSTITTDCFKEANGNGKELDYEATQTSPLLHNPHRPLCRIEMVRDKCTQHSKP